MIHRALLAEVLDPPGAAAGPEPARLAWLRLFLRVLSAGLLAAFIPWITLIVLHARVLQPDGALATLLRFKPYNPSYETMLAAIHIVWAIMLWRASDDPVKHVLFIDFTIWANAAHALVMLVVTPMQKGALMMVFETFPLFLVAAALMWLRPRPLRS